MFLFRIHVSMHVKRLSNIVNSTKTDRVSQRMISFFRLSIYRVEIEAKILFEICGFTRKLARIKQRKSSKNKSNSNKSQIKNRTFSFLLQVSTLLPQNFLEHELRFYCKNRDPTICSIVRCAFKDYCIEKKYITPKVYSEDE